MLTVVAANGCKRSSRRRGVRRAGLGGAPSGASRASRAWGSPTPRAACRRRGHGRATAGRACSPPAGTRPRGSPRSPGRGAYCTPSAPPTASSGCRPPHPRTRRWSLQCSSRCRSRRIVTRTGRCRARRGGAAGIRSSPERSRHIAVCGCSVPRVGTLAGMRQPICIAHERQDQMPRPFQHPAGECAIEVVAPLWLTRSFSVHGSEQSMFSHRDGYVMDASSDAGIH